MNDIAEKFITDCTKANIEGVAVLISDKTEEAQVTIHADLSTAFGAIGTLIHALAEKLKENPTTLAAALFLNTAQIELGTENYKAGERALQALWEVIKDKS